MKHASGRKTSSVLTRADCGYSNDDHCNDTSLYESVNGYPNDTNTMNLITSMPLTPNDRNDMPRIDSLITKKSKISSCKS